MTSRLQKELEEAKAELNTLREDCGLNSGCALHNGVEYRGFFAVNLEFALSFRDRLRIMFCGKVKASADVLTKYRARPAEVVVMNQKLSRSK